MNDDSMKMRKANIGWKKMTPREKWGYFLQYYKWPAIGGLFLVLLIAITLMQSLASKSSDYKIVLLGGSEIGKCNTTSMKSALVDFTTKQKGTNDPALDTPNVAVLAYTGGNNTDIDSGNDVNLSLTAQLGEPVIFIASPSEYRRLTDTLHYELRNLTRYVSASKTVDGKSVLYKNSNLYAISAFGQNIPDDYQICMLDKRSDKTDKKTVKMQKNTEDVLKMIIG